MQNTLIIQSIILALWLFCTFIAVPIETIHSICTDLMNAYAFTV